MSHTIEQIDAVVEGLKQSLDKGFERSFKNHALQLLKGFLVNVARIADSLEKLAGRQ